MIGSAKATAGTGSSGSTNENGSSSNTGAIAGGVVGGVLGLALIGGLVWFLWRRKQRTRQGYHQSQSDSTYMAVVEADGHPRANMRPEEADSHPMIELPVRNKPSQPSPGQVHELEGRYPR